MLEDHLLFHVVLADHDAAHAFAAGRDPEKRARRAVALARYDIGHLDRPLPVGFRGRGGGGARRDQSRDESKRDQQRKEAGERCSRAWRGHTNGGGADSRHGCGRSMN